MKRISKDIQKINEYRDQINSGLFQIYKILSSEHIEYIDNIIKIRQLVSTQLESLISELMHKEE